MTRSRAALTLSRRVCRLVDLDVARTLREPVVLRIGDGDVRAAVAEWESGVTTNSSDRRVDAMFMVLHRVFCLAGGTVVGAWA
jgi:hypothetical protein